MDMGGYGHARAPWLSVPVVPVCFTRFVWVKPTTHQSPTTDNNARHKTCQAKIKLLALEMETVVTLFPHTYAQLMWILLPPLVTIINLFFYQLNRHRHRLPTSTQKISVLSGINRPQDEVYEYTINLTGGLANKGGAPPGGRSPCFLSCFDFSIIAHSCLLIGIEPQCWCWQGVDPWKL